MRYDWDPAKNEQNIRTHGIDFADAVGLFFSGHNVLYVPSPREGEPRIVAIGRDSVYILIVVFVDRDDVRWIISARFASRKERRLYHG